MRRSLTAAVLMLAGLSAQAASLELNLNDEMAELVYAARTDSLGAGNGEGAIGLLFNEDDDWVASLRLLSVNRVSNALSFNVGFKGYYANLDAPDENFGALAIGGGVKLGLASQVPVAVALDVFLAPDILTSGDAEGVDELSLRLEAQLAPQAAAYVGYRLLEADFGRRDHEVVDGAFLGIRIGF